MSDLTASPALRLASLAVVVFVLLAALAACQAGRAPAPAPPAAAATPGAGELCTTHPKDDYFPTAGWRAADPDAHGVDANRLAAMMDYVKLKGLDVRGVVVVRDGYVVFEQYPQGQGPDSRAEVYSVTKSFASTLAGIAQRKGLLPALDAKILDLLPGDYANVDARKQAMTLEDVLTMRAGLAWTDDDPTIAAFYSSPDPVQYMLDLPMAAAPGTEFNYCSGCSHLLTTLVTRVTGMKAQDFAQQELLGPLGIEKASWSTGRDGIAFGGWGLSLTAREMAKLGYLFLRGGKWDGRQVVTPEWIEAATKKQTPTDSANGYGYQWWTHPKFPAYMALGRSGQTVYVNPEKNLVVAVRAQLPNHDAIYYLLETYVEPAVK